MGEMNSSAILASYATFKELYRSNKYRDPYQILSEFISYIIISKSLRQFSLTDIQSYLINEFGFHAPLAVINSSTNRIGGMTFQNGFYRPDLKKIKLNHELQEYQIRNEEHNKVLIDDLVEYTKQNYPDMRVEKGMLSQDLITFLLDEPGDNGYSRIIGEYVLQRENNERIKSTLESIREGSILYSGLNCHIDDVDMNSSELNLYLDTEILFDIVGLHGNLYKALAYDFLELVDAANKNGRKINLRYFLDVKKDIDKFYGAAERIVEENTITFDDAMKEIITGCSDASDVVEKKTQFYRTIQNVHNIQQDTKENYYTQDDKLYNLEAELPNFPITEEANYEGLKFCSHINKLRKGYQTHNYLECKFLCVSDTRRVIEISRALTNHNQDTSSEERYCDYAVNLNKITNILWFLLNRGFGSKELPKTIDVVIKARIILSAYISQGVTENYKEIRRKLENKEITEEEAAGYTLSLRKKHTLPEDISADNLKEELDFSEKTISFYVEENAANRNLINEQMTQIKALNNEIVNLGSKLEDSNSLVKRMQNEMAYMKDIINKEEKKKKEQELEKKRRKNKRQLLWAIMWKCLVLIVIIFLSWIVCKLLKIEFTAVLGIVISVISIIPILTAIVRRDKKRYLENKKYLDEEEM